MLCKGGHRLNDANDFLWQKEGSCWFRGKRVKTTNAHGTGCTLSSAIASNLAGGMSLKTAVSRGKDYLSGTLSAMLDLNAGSGPAEIVAVILACSWSYAEIGRALATIPGAVDHSFYGERIRSYAAEIYQAAHRELIDLLDQLTQTAGEETIEELTDIFAHCSRYELDFGRCPGRGVHEYSGIRKSVLSFCGG